MIKKMLHINGVPKTVIAESETMLADVLREQLKLTGTKVGCGQGQCGCCSVILDGKVVRSCITKMKRVEDGARVTTIEGIGTPDNLHALQMAWTVHGGAQCGFCSPGFIVSAKALLEENQEPHAQAGPGLVPETPQRLPLHRLQAAGGRGHGRGQGAAGRDDLERSGVQAAGRRPNLGHDLSAALGRGQGHRHHRLRCRPGPQNAARHPAAGSGPGQGVPRQDPVHRHLKRREDARGRQKSSPTRTSKARTASPA